MTTIKELRAQAKQRGIKIPANARKATIEMLLSERPATGTDLGEDWNEFERFLRKKKIPETDIRRQKNQERARQLPKPPKPKPRRLQASNINAVIVAR